MTNLERLAQMGELLKTQDNFMTSEPMFLVQILLNKQWVSKECFFTRAAAEKAIARNNDYSKETIRLYVDSGHRNSEWCLMRDFLMNDAAELLKALSDAK